MGLKILSVASAVPEKVVSNDELSNIIDTSDEWITSRTGIKQRHVATFESLTDLCESAALKAIEKSGLSLKDIDMVICSTACGDYAFPSLACCLIERLSIFCPAFDINAACSGFVYALDVASTYLSQNKAKNILVICGELMSKLADWTDRSTCVLFGDGAAACVLTSGEAVRYLNLTANGNTTMLNLVSSSGNSPYTEKKERGYLYMQGQEVFRFAVSMIESEINKALESLNLNADDIDHFILHQANLRIIDFARTKLKQPAEKFSINIEKYGNISSVSIPLLLDEMINDGKIKKGDKIVFVAFGAGLTTGTCVMFWE